MKTSLLILFFAASFSLFAQNYSKVKIHTDGAGLQRLAELGLAVDHGQYKENTFFISDFSTTEIDLIRSNGFLVDILIADVQKFYVDQNLETAPSKNTTCAGGSGGTTSSDPVTPSNFNLGTMGGYLKYQEMLDELDAMAAQYPNLITVKAPISTYLTFESRPIYHVVMSDNPAVNENEPKVLYTAIHHAREPMSMSQTIFYMWYLLENYDTNEEVKFLVDNTQLFFVPCINPDGYIYNETTNPNGGGMHRKNRRNVGSSNKGVDLNRNYSYGWGTTGISMNTNDDTYPGTAAFSEPETQAMRWLHQNHTFVTAMNAHTYGDQLLFPIGTTNNEFADHHDYFVDLTAHMVEQNGYLAQKSSGLYPASGDSDDYAYKVDVNVGVKDSVFAFTPEIGPSFWPAQSEIIPTCTEMVFPNMIMAHVPHKYMVTKDTDPGIIETMTGNFNHSAYRLGLEDGIVTVSIEPLLNIQTVGNTVDHDLSLRETATGAISFSLDPAIQFGDQIKYVLNTEYALWTKRDTIVKTYGSLTLQFTDDATATTNWTGNWATTTATFVSPTKSFTDSPSANYTSNTTKTWVLNQTIDLTNVTAAQVSFYAKWAIEADYDYCQFQVSSDGGTNWEGQCGLYTNAGTSADGSVQPDQEPIYDGSQASWVLEEINLSQYIGQTINCRFILKSDGGVNQDGYYFDDFKISYNQDFSGLEEMNFVSLASPNPATSYSIVSFSKVLSSGSVEVVDQFGKLVYTKNITEQINKVEIPVASWENGMYTVRVNDGTTYSLPVKMVVVH